MKITSTPQRCPATRWSTCGADVPIRGCYATLVRQPGQYDHKFYTIESDNGGQSCSIEIPELSVGSNCAIRELERRVNDQRLKTAELERAVIVLTERMRLLQEEMARLEAKTNTLDKRLWNFVFLTAFLLVGLVWLLVALPMK